MLPRGAAARRPGPEAAAAPQARAAPLSKLKAARCRLAFGLALACEPPTPGSGGGDVLGACPPAYLDVDVMPRLLRSLRTVAPLTDESIRVAVDMFKAESRDFDSPVAAARWGRVADWDVSSVVSMTRLFEGAAAFDQDIGGWEVGAVRDMSFMFDGAAFDASESAPWYTGG